MIISFNQKERTIFLDDSELNLQQYYSYYKQISKIL
jgi:hypothetical protein